LAARKRTERRPHAQNVADAKLAFEQALCGDILAELAHRQRRAADLAAPELVMFERIAIDRLVDAAMRREIGLAVADEIEPLQGQRRVDRRFENPGAKRHAPVGDKPRLADIQGGDFAVHVGLEQSFPEIHRPP
jgi:hypothetical protein